MSRQSSLEFAILTMGVLCALLPGCVPGRAAAAPDDGGGTGEENALQVCASPDNLPFSNARLEGFENRLADLISMHLGRAVTYQWQSHQFGFVRDTLPRDECDLILGVPARLRPGEATVPYYRSSYVFVYRTGERYRIRSLDDAVLRKLRIGVHVDGGDERVPPAGALARRGITRNVQRFASLPGDTVSQPAARLIDAVAKGDLDVAIVWGPLAGYHAAQHSVRLSMVPVLPQREGNFPPLAFDIGIGVRPDDDALRQAIDAVVQRRQREITDLLLAYGVPVLDGKAEVANR
jgi:quinoprotein dehydrogenase-associated probable ABC transporter substrate-binding protein